MSTSGYYAWRDRLTSPRARSNLELVEVIKTIHADSRGTYGAPRVHAELRLGAPQLTVGRHRVERLMRVHGIVGLHRRRHGGVTVRDPAASPNADLVERGFRAEGPDQLWCCDITQHRTGEGWLYCAVVLDVYSRRVVGWSIADHLRSEIVVDALDMACWRRKPPGQSVGGHGILPSGGHLISPLADTKSPRGRPRFLPADAVSPPSGGAVVGLAGPRRDRRALEGAGREDQRGDHGDLGGLRPHRRAARCRGSGGV